MNKVHYAVGSKASEAAEMKSAQLFTTAAAAQAFADALNEDLYTKVRVRHDFYKYFVKEVTL